jgi:hypothetical protein
MTSGILEICATIIAVSITSVFAFGSLAIVCGIVMMLLGKDSD